MLVPSPTSEEHCFSITSGTLYNCLMECIKIFLDREYSRTAFQNMKYDLRTILNKFRNENFNSVHVNCINNLNLYALSVLIRHSFFARVIKKIFIKNCTIENYNYQEEEGGMFSSTNLDNLIMLYFSRMFVEKLVVENCFFRFNDFQMYKIDYQLYIKTEYHNSLEVHVSKQVLYE